MSDLLTHPMCREEDLGKPIPDTEFGVSVCLPLWRHVVGYEEKDPDIVAKFKSGYPRFCCPPAIGALFETAAKDLGETGERALVFPRVVHAERCLEFIGRSGFTGRAVEWKTERFGVALFPAEAYETARRFWRFCGEVVSTRQAAEALGTATSGVTDAEGKAASAIIRQRLAQLSG